MFTRRVLRPSLLLWSKRAVGSFVCEATASIEQGCLFLRNSFDGLQIGEVLCLLAGFWDHARSSGQIKQLEGLHLKRPQALSRVAYFCEVPWVACKCVKFYVYSPGFETKLALVVKESN